MSSFVFAVIVALICAGPKNSQARTEGKYVVSNSDLDCPIDPWTNVLKIILMTTLFDFFLALQRRNMSILSIQATGRTGSHKKYICCFSYGCLVITRRCSDGTAWSVVTL